LAVRVPIKRGRKASERQCQIAEERARHAYAIMSAKRKRAQSAQDTLHRGRDWKRRTQPHRKQRRPW